jgi:septal ring factor EnvC (AmiA/AmiB activator)
MSELSKRLNVVTASNSELLQKKQQRIISLIAQVDEQKEQIANLTAQTVQAQAFRTEIESVLAASEQSCTDLRDKLSEQIRTTQRSHFLIILLASSLF